MNLQILMHQTGGFHGSQNQMIRAAKRTWLCPVVTDKRSVRASRLNANGRLWTNDIKERACAHRLLEPLWPTRRKQDKAQESTDVLRCHVPRDTALRPTEGDSYPSGSGGVKGFLVGVKNIPEIDCQSASEPGSPSDLVGQGGADVRHVQKLLGNSCLQSTTIYTRVFPKDLTKAVEKAHPRERLYNRRRKRASWSKG